MLGCAEVELALQLLSLVPHLDHDAVGNPVDTRVAAPGKVDRDGYRPAGAGSKRTVSMRGAASAQRRSASSSPPRRLGELAK